jgi:hypothetical protein
MVLKATIRTTVVLSRDLVEAVDRLVGARRRSRYVEEAVAERLRRDHQMQALEDAAGVLDPADYPHWATPEQTSAWVRALRREGDAQSMAKLRDEQDHAPPSS